MEKEIRITRESRRYALPEIYVGAMADVSITCNPIVYTSRLRAVVDLRAVALAAQAYDSMGLDAWAVLRDTEFEKDAYAYLAGRINPEEHLPEILMRVDDLAVDVAGVVYDGDDAKLALCAARDYYRCINDKGTRVFDPREADPISNKLEVAFFGAAPELTPQAEIDRLAAVYDAAWCYIDTHRP